MFQRLTLPAIVVVGLTGIGLAVEWLGGSPAVRPADSVDVRRAAFDGALSRRDAGHVTVSDLSNARVLCGDLTEQHSAPDSEVVDQDRGGCTFDPPAPHASRLATRLPTVQGAAHRLVGCPSAGPR